MSDMASLEYVTGYEHGQRDADAALRAELARLREESEARCAAVAQAVREEAAALERVRREAVRQSVINLSDDSMHDLRPYLRARLQQMEFEALDAGCETGEVAEATRRSERASLLAAKADLIESLLAALAAPAPTEEGTP